MDSPAQKQGTWLTNIVDTNGATIHMFGMSATNSIRSIFVFTDRDWNFIISSVVPSLRVVKDGLVRVLKHHHRRHSDIPLSLQPKMYQSHISSSRKYTYSIYIDSCVSSACKDLYRNCHDIFMKRIQLCKIGVVKLLFRQY